MQTPYFTADDVVAALRAAVVAAGGQARWAEPHGIPPNLVSMCLSNHEQRLPSPSIVNALGFRKLSIYAKAR